MKLSIYIPTLTRDALFMRAYASVEHSIAFASEHGLSVTDNDYEIVIVEGVRPVSRARDEALRRTTGDWILGVDADDEVTEDWFLEIARTIRRIERDGLAVDDVVFDYYRVRNGTEIPCHYGRGALVDSKVLVDDMLRDMRLCSYVFCHAIRKSLFENVSFGKTSVLEDYMTLPVVFSRARKAAYISKALYHYVENAQSLTATVCSGEMFDLAKRRAAEFGPVAAIGACVIAYHVVRMGADSDGAARQWIRVHLFAALFDRNVSLKWKLRLLYAGLL